MLLSLWMEMGGGLRSKVCQEFLDIKEIAFIVKLVKVAVQYKVKMLTLYTFSTENWKPPKSEVDSILRIPKEFLHIYLPDLITNNVRIEIIDDMKNLPSYTYESLHYAMDRTRDNNTLQLNITINYGSRQEILYAMKIMLLDLNGGKLALDNLNEQQLSKYLYTASIKDPDLLIRTGG